MDEADDVILVLFAERIARELFLEDDVEVRVEIVLDVEADHVRARRHDFADVEVGEIKDVVDEVGLGIVDEALLVAFLHEQADFFLGVRLFALTGRLETHASGDPVRDVVQQPDERVHDALENEHRQRDGQDDMLDVLDRHRLRRKLAEHDVAARDDGESERERNRVPDSVIEACHPRERQDQRRDERLADPAETERSERDAELRDGKRGVEVVGELLGIRRPLVPRLDQRLKARRTDFHNRKFRCDEEAVHEDEEEDEEKLKEDRDDVHGCCGASCEGEKLVHSREIISSGAAKPSSETQCRDSSTTFRASALL